MRKLRFLIFFLIGSFFLFSAYTAIVKALECDTERLAYENASDQDKISKNQAYQSCLSSQVNKLGAQAKTLSNQIAQFDAQIRLTSLKIAETEEKILLLGGRIDQLEASISDLSTAFSSRAVETYKMTRSGLPFFLLISSNDLSEAVTRYNYLQRIQEADQTLLGRLQTAQTEYKGEKSNQEDLQKELERQKTTLSSQKAAKANLLAVTRNDEKTYQSLLAKARAEYAAIVAITAGKGVETEVGHVNEGQRIASVIQGSSCNSSGTHLHFIVRKPGGITDNPFNYLKGGISYNNISGGDPFNPSGGWEWPINPTINYSQGYGSTWAIRNTWVGSIYSFHNGIDINGSSSEIKAVKGGKLYRGSYNVGCLLRYVRVDHDDSDIDTLYLHVDY